MEEVVRTFESGGEGDGEGKGRKGEDRDLLRGVGGRGESLGGGWGEEGV